MKSDVYFIKLHYNDAEARGSSLRRLLQSLDPFSFYKIDEFIPVKLTIGDGKCVYNINPELVKIIIHEIKNKKAKPFVFDTSVIYKGSRRNAIDHLALAQNKGFTHSKIAAPFIIADGLFGYDGKEHSLNSKHLKKIKLPSFIGMVDSLVVLSHATCHILSGYAGAIKNVAMGMVSKPTKQVQHSSLKPHVIDEICASCGLCIEICPVNAISPLNPTLSPERKGLGEGEKAFIDQAKCIGCGECLSACKFDSIFINWDEDIHIFLERLAESASFILSKFKNKFFINFAFDITKECDCISTKNEKIVCSDIGILASNDIVSIDAATIDLINKDGDIILKEKSQHAYKKILEYAHERGLGNPQYNLITI